MKDPRKFLKPLSFLTLLFIISFLFPANLKASESEGGEAFNPGETIMHHVKDDYIWHFFDGHYGTLYLPVILYNSDGGSFDVFSSHNFYDEHHNHIPYNGYEIDHGKIVSVDNHEATIIDFSITKNVLTVFITAILIFLIFRAVAKGYTKNHNKAPTGIQSFFEPIIIFVRDEVVKPNIGPKYEKYLPYMLTLFFYVWIGNLLGLLPGAANMTGNIAVTMSLAIGTLILTTISGNKAYWGHIFNTPGVPLPLKPIIVPVEIIGIFTKPISLMIRLFVAITAGHIVMLSLISLTFIFHSWAVGFGSSIITLFVFIIELLVAAIQAYVFTMFSSLYIGMAVAEDHH